MQTSNEKQNAFATGWHRETIYTPEVRPGFVAWTTAFDYGDGSIGLTFKETLRQPNPDYTEPKLEFAESAAFGVSYSSVTWGCETQRSYRVYMRSYDNGKTFVETGRAPENVGSFCNVGFPDGRIVGFNVPEVNEEGTSWGHRLDVRESTDGGNTWTLVEQLLPGNAIYMWRVRRLRDGTIIAMATLYGTAWGPGYERTTRNTMLPDESYVSKIQTFFLTSQDGRTFTGPHYILPGTGAHEFDVVELADGNMLFIAGDVQATPVARQKVRRENGRFINEPVHTIRRGAPPEPATQPQGGFVPETMVMLPDGLIVGSRRNKPYSCSADLGENWYEIDGLPTSLYQPFMQLMPDGTIANFGHFGGDVAFGQADMFVGADYFKVENHLPRTCKLALSRCLAADGSHYENRYRARLTCGGAPVAGEEVVFRFLPYWNTAEENAVAPPENAPHTFRAVTGADGCAEAEAKDYDRAGDIHFAYTIQASYEPAPGAAYTPCESSTMAVQALRPYRCNRYPHNAYFAEGTLYLSPSLLERFPNAIELLKPLAGTQSDLLPAGSLPDDLAAALLQSHVLYESPEGLRWRRSVHMPAPLADVLPMADGDWFI